MTRRFEQRDKKRRSRIEPTSHNSRRSAKLVKDVSRTCCEIGCKRMNIMTVDFKSCSDDTFLVLLCRQETNYPVSETGSVELRIAVYPENATRHGTSRCETESDGEFHVNFTELLGEYNDDIDVLTGKGANMEKRIMMDYGVSGRQTVTDIKMFVLCKEQCYTKMNYILPF